MLLGATGRPLTPSGSARVEHPSDPVTDLDGLESAAEGLVELPSTSRSSLRSNPWSPTGRSVPVAPLLPNGHLGTARPRPSLLP